MTMGATLIIRGGRVMDEKEMKSGAAWATGLAMVIDADGAVAL